MSASTPSTLEKRTWCGMSAMATMMVVQSQTLRSARVRNAIHEARGRHTTRVCDYSGYTRRAVAARLLAPGARARTGKRGRTTKSIAKIENSQRGFGVFVVFTGDLYSHPKFSLLHMIWETLPRRQWVSQNGLLGQAQPYSMTLKALKACYISTRNFDDNMTHQTSYQMGRI